VLLTLIA
jgi:hypothetical protein